MQKIAKALARHKSLAPEKLSEQAVQRAVFQHIRTRGAPGVIAFHPANGGWRRPVEAAILKGLGVTAGVADIIALHRGHAYAIELKADGGRPTANQMEFISNWNAAGGTGAIVAGLDQALTTLEAWGLLRGRA
jgi:hypothetical protein